MSKISASERKMLSLQQQMAQNNEDLKSFMKDLDSWEADVKQKDEELKSRKTIKETVLPPVRNSLDKKKKKKVKKKDGDADSGGKTKRISSYDYRAWDKFDVDKACEDVDETLEGSSSEYETDEEWEVERKKQAAIMEKDKGNDYFKHGDYGNAIECYTKGAELDPTNPLLPANRAMALLKQEKYGAAEIDCTIALSLDPLYTKAYLRRGSARMGLQKFTAAKEDYERVLSLEPQNKKAKLDLEIIEKELSKENLVTHADTEAAKDEGIVKAIFKAPEQRSKKPLRRIYIEEVGLEDDLERRSAIAKVEQGQGQVKKELMEKDNQMFERFTAKSPGTERHTKLKLGPHMDSRLMYHVYLNQAAADIGRMSLHSSESFESDHSQHSSNLQNGLDTGQGEDTSAASKIQFCDNLEQNGQDLSERSEEDVISSEAIAAKMKQTYSNVPNVENVEPTKQDIVKTKVPSPRGQGDGERRSVSSPRGQGQVSPRGQGQVPAGEKTVPTTSFQFQTDYKSLKHSPEGFYHYLKNIPASEYAKLFGEFLDAEVLLKVLHVFREFYIRNGESFYENMKCLAGVKRFSMTVMFFSNKEKKVIKDLIEYLRRAGQCSESEINNLAGKYELR